jgi:hypothetical protein
MERLKETRFRVALSLTGLALFLLAIWIGVVEWVGLDMVEPVGPKSRRWIMTRLRTALRGDDSPPEPGSDALEELKRELPGPVFVELYLRGKVIFRHVSRPGASIKESVDRAANELYARNKLQQLAEEDLNAARFKVDLTRAKGPIVTAPRILLALSVVPGIDGLGLDPPDGPPVYIPPDELLRRNLVTGYQPFKFVKEFKAGLHIDAAMSLLARRAGLEEPKKGELPPGDVFRFRTQGFVEPPANSSKATGPGAKSEGAQDEGRQKSGRGDPLPVFRGNTPPPELNRRNVIRSIVDGGNYMLRMLARSTEKVRTRIIVGPKGKKRYQTEMELGEGERLITRRPKLVRGQFRYIYYPLVDNYRVVGYSLPRHAGTTHALALLAGILKDNPHVSKEQVEKFRKGAVLAIEFLADRVKKGRCTNEDFTCVSLGPVTDLGSTALPVVAIMEYTRQTGDRRFVELGRKMANFLVYMQKPHKDKPDGEFCHLYSVKKRIRECKTRMLYYSGEAALALAMAHEVLGDDVYLEATEKALDYQTTDYLAPLTMKFLYGEDHWTAMAAEEIWPTLDKQAYADFAYGFARFQQRQQFVSGEAFEDYVGGYGITPFFPPHLTPAGSRTEAAVSAYRLSQKRKETLHSIRNQCLRAYRYIITHQVRPENSYMFVDPQMSRGAIRKSPVKFDVRIDYVQHTMNAMVRGLDMVPE